MANYMNIYAKGKSRYIISALDGKDYNLTTGHFKRHLDSHGISLADYFTEYEKIERDLCQACGKPAAFYGYNPDNTVRWHSVCGDHECAKVMYSRAHLSRTEENWKAASEKRRKTFAENPEVLASRTKIIHEANQRIGEDGLTGYERTAKKRAETLLKKHGRTDYANWEKTKRTWKEKSSEDIKAHGEKIRTSWTGKSDVQKACEIEKRRQTNIKLYGMECPGNLAKFAGYSKLASSLFDAINPGEAEFKPRSKEFSVNGKLFDFRYGKKLIEFNGDYWHANPLKYDSTFLVGRNRKRSAQQIWEADAAKIKLAEEAGYQVKVVWESEYRKDPERVIEECAEWLIQNNK